MELLSLTTDYDKYINEPNNRELDHLPGDYGYPLIGHSAQFLKDPFEFAQAYDAATGCCQK